MYLITYFIWFLLTVQSIIRAENSYRSKGSQKMSTGQGRTFGLFNPFNLANIGLNSLIRPTYSDYTGSSQAFRPSYRPTTSTRRPQLADPYYGYYGYPGNYGNYPYYNYGGYPPYGAYYPPINYGAYPGQYGGNFYQRPSPIYQPYYPPAGNYGNFPATNSGYTGTPTGSTNPGLTNPGITTPLTGGPATSSAQLAQLANLLGQILGQQLRPLINPGGVTSADTINAKI